MIIAVFLITVLIVFAIQWYIARKKFYKFAENIPSAKNYGILGHGPHFLGKDDEGVFEWNFTLEIFTNFKIYILDIEVWYVKSEKLSRKCQQLRSLFV